MAHEITKADLFGEIRARGERAWHGLGLEIPTGLSVKDGFSLIGLDWDTELEGVYVQRGGQLVKVDDFRAHTRLDTGSVLGIVGKDYKPVPNKVLASFADALVQADGAELETGGSLRGGRRVFALIRLKAPIRVEGDDILVPYLLIANVHDGTGAFRAYFTTVRVVCANTYRYAETRSGGAGFWFRHDGDITAKLEEARKVLGLAQEKAEVVTEEVQAMNNTTLVSPDGYFQRVYEATFGKRPEPKQVLSPEQQVQIGQGLLEQLLTKPSEVLDAAIEEYDRKRGIVVGAWTENFDSDPARGTVWGAFNSVTKYHDHQRGKGAIKERTMTDARVHSNLFGISATDKALAHSEAVRYL